MRAIQYKGWVIRCNYRSGMVNVERGHKHFYFDTQAEALEFIDAM